MKDKKVSIIILTHNAPAYVKLTIESLKKHTDTVRHEVIVVDNASGIRTRQLVKKMKKQGKIDTLIQNRSNQLFARGNNKGSEAVSADSTHILLLNSDVEIKSDAWLEKLLALCPEGGISAYGIVMSEPVRADGYCMLIEKEVYLNYKLDEKYEWFWSVTKLQSQLLRDGKKVIAVENHEELLHHFGGKSGNGFRHADGMDTEIQEIIRWFGHSRVDRAEYI